MFLQTAFTPIHSGISERSSEKQRASHSLNLEADSTPLGKPPPRRAVWRIRSFWVLDGDLQLFLKCLDLAGKMRFLLLHRKGLQTPADTHQFKSLSWTHTLKAVLLGCSVLVLEADISQYSVYPHSLWNIQTQLLEETASHSLRLNADSTPLGEHGTEQFEINVPFVF